MHSLVAFSPQFLCTARGSSSAIGQSLCVCANPVFNLPSDHESEPDDDDMTRSECFGVAWSATLNQRFNGHLAAPPTTFSSSDQANCAAISPPFTAQGMTRWQNHSRCLIYRRLLPLVFLPLHSPFCSAARKNAALVADICFSVHVTLRTTT